MTMPFLELANVTKGYGGPPVLSGVNLSIERGEFVAIVGYSGSGKTTLISMIAGLLRPDSGTVKLNGLEIIGPGPDRGVVFQNYSLLPWLTVYENIALAVDQAFPNYSAGKKRQHIERYVELVNLTPARDKRPAQLSGGMRQRVAVARALAMDLQVLLMDEPLSALDALTRATLQDEVARIWEQEHKTVVLITNDVDEAILLADRIIPLTPGPGATLSSPIAVALARPRNRKALNHNAEFARLRTQVTNQLLGFYANRRAAATQTLTLPDILPENIETSRALRRPPLRRSDITQGSAAPARAHHS